MGSFRSQSFAEIKEVSGPVLEAYKFEDVAALRSSDSFNNSNNVYMVRMFL